jgi:hypothetical protein
MERKPNYNATFETVWAMFEESAKRMDELQKSLDKTNKIVTGIGNNTGAFAEEYFYNALSKTKRMGGIKYVYVSKNVKSRVGKIEGEFDVVMYNGNSVALIETKFCAHPNFFEKTPEERVGTFRTLFPQYAHHKIYLGIASMSFNDEVVRQARDFGVVILKQNGETLECDAENIKAY